MTNAATVLVPVDHLVLLGRLLRDAGAEHLLEDRTEGIDDPTRCDIVRSICLQAQLIEDEIGEGYFRALGALDSDTPNAAHALLAELACQGRIASILTTNFDTTIERAFDAVGVPYRLFTSPDDFERLHEDSPALPIVKIHGSATRPETMVDTLRQRLQHRPAALEAWMRARFLASPTIGLGFSCDDLQYNEDYLGIRPAARDGARFCFLVRMGSEPSKPLAKLAAESPDSVLTSCGDLPGWLFYLARALDVEHAVPLPAFTSEDATQRRVLATQRLGESLRDWADALGAMGTMNAVTSLLAATGSRHDADFLLRRMWEFYRAPEDCSGPAYARYLHNYGETLLRTALLRNPRDRQQDFRAWKDAADRDPQQFFFRAEQVGGGLDSKARRLLCDLLGGSRVSALHDRTADVLRSLGSLIEREHPLPRPAIDACFTIAEFLELLGLGRGATGMLEHAHRSSIAIGDEMRRAEATWRRARNLAFATAEDASSGERVAALAAECTAIATRLDIREADAGAALARAIDAIARCAYGEASEHARAAETIYRELEDLPGEIFAKRERVRAFMGEASQSGTVDLPTWDELSRALQTFALERAPGLRSIIKYELANLARYFDDRLAFDLARDAAEEAVLQEHPLLVTEAAELRDALTTGQT